MEFLLDTVNLDAITHYLDVIPLTGVTSNPSICKKEGHFPFFEHMLAVQSLLDGRELHVQVVGQTTEAMIQDAHMLLKQLGNDVYIKVPTNDPGLAAMKQLKIEGVHVTATAIYTAFQGLLAIGLGVDYIAPYYNRMCNMNIDAASVIRQFAQAIDSASAPTKILAASFHNVAQVTTALASGAQAVTMGPDVAATGLAMPAIRSAVSDFTADWESLYGSGQTVTSLGTK